MRILRLLLLTVFMVLPIASELKSQVPDFSTPIFVPVKIDGPVHDPANFSYWFGPFPEACSVLDMDGDGDLDIAAGRNWYENPSWIKHAEFRDGAETNGPETDEDGEFALDVDFDGKQDIVYGGWQFMNGVLWYKNGNDTELWESNRIYSINRVYEGTVHGDIDGDGDEDLLVNHYAQVAGKGVSWFEHINQPPWFVNHKIGTKGDIHGNGIGDINGDGRIDVVTPQGWYEQPVNNKELWPFHEDYSFFSYYPTKGGRHSENASHPMLVFDVNEDGKNDIIIGSSHCYGLVWLEQQVDATGKRSFKENWIETDGTQYHTLTLGDLNGDGKPDLVTGKRLFAHHGDDIGAGEPLFAYWYDIQKGKFVRHVLSYNHLPHYSGEMVNPAPNFVVSVGMNVHVIDVNNDGKNDIVTSGKGGLYAFMNQGTPPKAPIPEKLFRETTYTNWRNWMKFNMIFNNDDFTGWKVPAGDKGHWKVVNGCIEYDGMSASRKSKNLESTESFKDFTLHIEWRITGETGLKEMPFLLSDGTYKKDKEGNIINGLVPNTESGIYLRGTDIGAISFGCWPKGSGEVISLRNNSSLNSEQRESGTPRLVTDKPVGRWNSMDITLIGNSATIFLNGHVVVENAIIPGLPEEGPLALYHFGAVDPSTGNKIPGNSTIQYRNILIQKLTDPTVSIGNGFDDFKDLFNGNSLDGWLTGPDNAWVVENGTLTIKRDMDGQEHNLDYLWTESQYENFILELEFKVADNTNSGIFFRTGDRNDPLYTGLEVQVQNSYGKTGLSNKGTAGAIYDVMTPFENAVKPAGEWNKCRITCQGSMIDVVLNGKLVIDMDVDYWDKPNVNFNGVPNKYPVAIKNFPRKGYIGLQDHGRPVWYRNIRVKKIPSI